MAECLTTLDPCTCNICLSLVASSSDRFNIEGKGKFDILSELRSLSIPLRTKVICRKCFRKCKKRCQLLEEISQIEDSLTCKLTKPHLGKRRSQETIDQNAPSSPKRMREVVFSTSSPVSNPRQSRKQLEWPLSPV